MTVISYITSGRLADPRGSGVAAPTAAGALADQSFTEDTGTQTYDASGDFTGDDLIYSVNLVLGVFIDSSTGVVGFNTDIMGVQAGTSIVVTASNAGGTAQSGFSLAITGAAVVADLAVTSTGLQDGAGGDVPITITSSIADATVECVMFEDTGTASADLTAADFGTGATTGYIDLGTISAPSGQGSVVLAFDDVDGDYIFAFLPTGGATADIAKSSAVTLATVPGATTLYDEDFTGATYDTDIGGGNIFTTFGDEVITFDNALTSPTISGASVGGITINRNDDFGTVRLQFACTPGQTYTFTGNIAADVYGTLTAYNFGVRFRNSGGSTVETPFTNQDGLNATTDVVQLNGTIGPFTAPATAATIEMFYYGRQNRSDWVIRDLTITEG